MFCSDVKVTRSASAVDAFLDHAKETKPERSRNCRTYLHLIAYIRRYIPAATLDIHPCMYAYTPYTHTYIDTYIHTYILGLGILCNLHAWHTFHHATLR